MNHNLLSRQTIWAKRNFGKTLDDQTINENASSIEDNLPMVNYIMLHRIYDMMTLIAMKLAGEEETSRMVQYHEKGYLLGPTPAYTVDEE
jgi:hypothetical protein